jgi:hypothetical protein
MLDVVETWQCPVSTIFLPGEIPQITCIHILKWLIECNEISLRPLFAIFAQIFAPSALNFLAISQITIRCHSPVKYYSLPIIFIFLLLCLAYYYFLYISLYRISKFIT